MLFAEPLHPLGEADPRWRSILTPASEVGAARTGVTAQFLENAGDYHARYTHHEWFRLLIGRHLDLPPPRGAQRTILDVGSGSGNSVIPLLDLYPDAFVVATDVSPQLLAILRDALEMDEGYRGRYALVCMDANHDCLAPGAFDAAVGTSILHHIVDPLRVLATCATALAPGGVAFFTEPFEPGYAVLRMAYRRILAEAARRGEKKGAFAVLARMVEDHDARVRDKSDPAYEALDDKWVFTRAFFERAAASGPWRSWRVDTINGDRTPFLDTARVELRLNGFEPAALPSWAWEEIETIEVAFTPEAKRDMLLEGALRFERNDAPAHARVEEPPRWWWNPDEPGSGFFVQWDAGVPRTLAFAYAKDGRAECSPIEPEAVHRDFSRDRLVVALDGRKLVLERQHPGSSRDARAGRWDEARGSSSLVVEAVGERMVAALFDAEGWTLTVAEPNDGRFEGEWLRFSGGQPLRGRYRPPAPARSLGRSSLSWMGDVLEVSGPGPNARSYRRAPPAGQNERSTEKCAS